MSDDWKLSEAQGGRSTVHERGNEIKKFREFVRNGIKMKIDANTWAAETKMAQLMSDNGIGPQVYEVTDEFMRMEKYGMDVLEAINNIRNDQFEACNRIHNKRKETKNNDVALTFKVAVMNRLYQTRIRNLVNSIEKLINKIATFYDERRDVAMCFGDFRFENIVVKQVGDTYEARQIDFDFCKTPENNVMDIDDIKRLYKLRLALIRIKEIMEDNTIKDVFISDVFENGMIFRSDIEKDIDNYERVFHAMKILSNRDKRIRGILKNLTYLYTKNWIQFRNWCLAKPFFKQEHRDMFVEITAGKATFLPMKRPREEYEESTNKRAYMRPASVGHRLRF